MLVADAVVVPAVYAGVFVTLEFFYSKSSFIKKK